MEPKKIFVILSLILFTSIALISIGILYAEGVEGMGLNGNLSFHEG